jgi:hypothetical protein
MLRFRCVVIGHALGAMDRQYFGASARPTGSLTSSPSLYVGPTVLSVGGLLSRVHTRRSLINICVSSSVSNSISRALQNSPATHGLELFRVVGPASLLSRSFSSTSPRVGAHLTVFFHQVKGLCIGLMGCFAATMVSATMVSSLRGCICVAIALPENSPWTNRLRKPEPLPPAVAS